MLSFSEPPVMLPCCQRTNHAIYTTGAYLFTTVEEYIPNCTLVSPTENGDSHIITDRIPEKNGENHLMI